ncbi:AAA family ATPase [Sphingobium boeckii]|uniref:Exopolysaccharide/PEP-CTERM locus tyrosine autokinase n=1 Tax=Sphingobium boeckii TaxID=1082345 RepID=A0A7W9EH51_9SPHN|nr:AAA family ATPase [Sphingobium boeckii]MBB5687396.1 exopolysaccharide/PEP-CTERM locus tyrosine autokinase [Sphingobium boeckii]
MNKHTSLKARGSLLERAAEAYDFQKLFAPPAATPEAEIPPVEAQPAPIAVAPPVRMESVAPRWVPMTPVPFTLAKPEAVPVPAPKADRTGHIDREALAEAGFIVPDAPVSALSEEFRIAKRQLLIAARGDAAGPLPKGRMILVCSAQPNEGKTFCAINLALSIAAEKDVDVLLVDGDFAKPEIPAILGLETGPGLMDALADPALDVERCVIRTDIPGLSVLPAGRQTHNDTEQLASAHTQAVLESLLAHDPARIVIIDSPPALAASPASVLALHAGQVLMVVRADQTSESDLRDAIGLLSGCETIQLLLNGVQMAAGGRRFGAYYGYGD